MYITRVIHVTVLVSLCLVYECSVAFAIWVHWFAVVTLLSLPLKWMAR